MKTVWASLIPAVSVHTTPTFARIDRPKIRFFRQISVIGNCSRDGKRLTRISHSRPEQGRKALPEQRKRNSCNSYCVREKSRIAATEVPADTRLLVPAYCEKCGLAVAAQRRAISIMDSETIGRKAAGRISVTSRSQAPLVDYSINSAFQYALLTNFDQLCTR